MTDIELVYPARDEVGEGPLWHPGEQALYWVDNETNHYHRFEPSTGLHALVDLGEKACVLVYRQRGGLVVATDRGFSFFDPRTGQLEHIGNPEAGKTGAQFNDGKVDRQGRFWAGTLGDPHNNSLYRLDPDRSIHRLDTGFDISNGLGWSPDNRVMYFVDSTPMHIYAYDFDLESGSLANRRVFVDRSAKPGVPDGLTVDAEGFIWVAVWDGACVERYDPAGRLAHKIDLPVRCPTSLAFGGPNLDELYITSALYEIPPAERANHPLDGGLLRVRGAGQGLPEPGYGG